MTLSGAVSASELSMRYEASGAGLPLLNAVIEVEENPDVYTIQMHSETIGVLSFLIPAQAFFETQGKIEGGSYLPVSFMSMRPDQPQNPKKRVVDFTQKVGLIDYQSILMRFMRDIPPQTRTFRIDDGRRQILMTAQYVGEEPAPYRPDDSWTETAAHYQIFLKVLKGKKGWFFEHTEDQNTPRLHFYFSKKNGEDAPRQFLTRAVFHTSLLGDIFIDLKETKSFP